MSHPLLEPDINEGASGGSSPPSPTPPTTSGGGIIIRLDPPATAGQGSQIQGPCQYNCSDDHRPIHARGSIRLYSVSQYAWFYGLCPPEAALGTDGTVSSGNLVGFLGYGNALSVVVKGQQMQVAEIEAGNWYTLSMFVGPKRAGVQFWYGQQYADIRYTLPSADVGLGLTLCSVALGTGDAFTELRGASAFQLV